MTNQVKRFLLVISALLVLFYIMMGFAMLPSIKADTKSRTKIELVQDVVKTVVTVWCDAYPTPATGVHIGGGRILTAGHVAEYDISKVVFEDGTTYEVLGSHVNDKCDLGILQVDRDIPQPFLELDLEEYTYRGETLYMISNPLGHEFLFTQGTVAHPSLIDDGTAFGEVPLIVTDLPSASGSSGAPIFDDDGELRGIHVGQFRTYMGSGVDALRYSIGVCEILDYLEDIRDAL